jgi:sterol-4alpha-carboxylate 3-dehydrogenase (decarboxylating)
MSIKKPLEILVTGGSGFLGRGIVERISNKHPEWKISILDIQPPPSTLEKRIVQYIETDITSRESVNNAFVDYSPDLVVHTAGIVPARKFRYSTKGKDWERVKAINYDGTRHVLDAAMASGCRHFVYTSSCTVVIDDLDHDYFYMNENVPIGHATLHYGKSKGMAESYVMSSKHAEEGLIACALRPCTIIGPGDTAVIGLIHDLIAKHETYFIVGDGDNFYDFMYIDNAVLAHVLAVENLLGSKTAAGQIFFISNQEPVYFWDFMAYIWAQFGHVPKYRVHIPASIAWAAGYALEWLTLFTGGAPTLDRGSVKDGVRTHFSDNRKAQRILGYEPKVGLAEGVRRSCEDYKKYLAANGSTK